MTANRLILILAGISAFCPTNFGNKVEAPVPKLLLVGYDGLRYDFVNEFLTPNLWRLCRQGVWSPAGMKPQVLTVTAPNFYTIATGLYQETHGIVANKFYDPQFDEMFDYFNVAEPGRGSLDAKWYGGEPIWQTNEKESRHRSGSMRYPMTDAQINNKTFDTQNIAPLENLGNLSQWKDDLDQLLSWFIRPNNSINFGMFYVPEPDHTKHHFEIYSSQVRQKLMELDDLTVYLMEQLENLNLTQSMNIIFASDHGHASVCENERVELDHFMNHDDYIYSSGSIFLTKNSSLSIKSLYNTLNRIRMKQPKFQIWLKNDIPDRFRYKKNRRVGPVFVMPFLGHSIAPLFKARSRKCHGEHGFSNEYAEMRPFFAARGPAFKSNFEVTKPIENIDLYNLMCMVLDVKPAPNNGSLDRVIGMLKDGY